jgi:protein SCO1/2
MEFVKYLVLASLMAVSFRCTEDFPFNENWSNAEYELLNQDSVKVNFPEIIKGKIAVVGFIYTNCPDICPLTTNNMKDIKKKLNEEGIEAEFITISFDPDFDKPSVLKKYAELRGIDFKNWQFLTGEKKTIRRLLKTAGVVAAIGDSTTFSDSVKIYYYVHTDRIALFDSNTHLRNNYFGSAVNTDEIVNDIKKLRVK